MAEKQDNKKGLAIGLGNLAIQQIMIGSLQSAEVNLRRRIKLCGEIKDEFNEAIGRQELGRVLSYRGEWADAEQELNTAFSMFEKEKAIQGQVIVYAYFAQRALLMARQLSRQTTGSPDSSDAAQIRATALSTARQMLEMADKFAKTDYPVERFYVQAHWLLGAAHRVNSHLSEADRRLTEALTPLQGNQFGGDGSQHPLGSCPPSGGNGKPRGGLSTGP